MLFLAKKRIKKELLIIKTTKIIMEFKKDKRINIVYNYKEILGHKKDQAIDKEYLSWTYKIIY